ncbi:MAG: hypothetical protein IPP71_09990 [Bacteroidetes bacterium]|nr:hypothetical protein [Bacteroidota bacterium]
MHALVLEYLSEQDEPVIVENLMDFIIEATAHDDGQLFKIYEKHFEQVTGTNQRNRYRSYNNASS